MMCELKGSYKLPEFNFDNKKVCEHCGALITMKELLAYNIQPGNYNISFKNETIAIVTNEPITVYGCPECNTLNINREINKERAN